MVVGKGGVGEREREDVSAREGPREGESGGEAVTGSSNGA